MAVTEEDKAQFRCACDCVIDQVRLEQGVGTLQEKTIHCVLKHYYAPDESMHERKMEGFVADIFTGSEIIEIQTRGFHLLRRKLEAFLPHYPVTVVFPVTHQKWLRWINEETGEVLAPRKSPKVGSAHALFPELYRVKMFLPNNRLTFRVVLLDVEEYRLLNGWSKDRKRGSSRSDGIPTELADEIVFHEKNDYKALIPEHLPGQFTSGEYGKLAHLSKTLSVVELNILNHLGVVKRIGKRGNSYLYEVEC